MTMTSKVNPLYGLVVCGGESSRMGMDKSLLVYHDKPQRYHLYDQLNLVCDRVFISCNKKQASTIDQSYEFIVDADKYENIGPMAAVLSAFGRFEQADFLVVACDYPFITTPDLKQLAQAVHEERRSTCFSNYETGIEEPLLAVYLKDNYPDLIRNFNNKKFSLRHFIKEENVKKISPTNAGSLLSIDTPEAYKAALEKIHFAAAHV